MLAGGGIGRASRSQPLVRAVPGALAAFDQPKGGRLLSYAFDERGDVGIMSLDSAYCRCERRVPRRGR